MNNASTNKAFLERGTNNTFTVSHLFDLNINYNDKTISQYPHQYRQIILKPKIFHLNWKDYGVLDLRNLLVDGIFKFNQDIARKYDFKTLMIESKDGFTFQFGEISLKNSQIHGLGRRIHLNITDF